jgi:hypothetical protein
MTYFGFINVLMDAGPTSAVFGEMATASTSHCPTNKTPAPYQMTVQSILETTKQITLSAV